MPERSLDARLRRALLAPASGAMLAALGLLTALAFGALLAMRTLTHLPDANALVCAVTLLCLMAPLALALGFALRAARAREMGLLPAAAVCAACAAAMLLRVSLIEHRSSDFDVYLSDWIGRYASMPFAEGMRAGVGEYNAPYQYILFIVSRLPVPPLYAVKAVSFLGDALLAGALAALCAKEGRASLTAMLCALLLPSVALNGALFAQCDSLYAACALWGLALALDGKPLSGAVCFALSLAFKLQALFMLPIAAVLWAGKRLRLTDALVFLGTLLVLALPALLCGVPLTRFAGVYTAQAGLYTGLTYGAPNLFGLMNTQGLDVYAYGNFGLALALGACALLVALGVMRADGLDRRGFVALSLLMTLSVFFFLPRMHERYIYLPVVLSLAAAGSDARYVPCAALLELAAFGALLDVGLALNILSLAVLAALTWAICCAKRA